MVLASISTIARINLVRRRLATSDRKFCGWPSCPCRHRQGQLCPVSLGVHDLVDGLVEGPVHGWGGERLEQELSVPEHHAYGSPGLDFSRQ